MKKKTMKKYLIGVTALLCLVVISVPLNAQEKKLSFNPEISVVLDLVYVGRTIEEEEDNVDDTYEDMELPGFQGSNQGVFNRENGVSLNNVELVLSSPVDPYFDMFINFHLFEFEFEVEEAFVTTRRIPYGFQFKLGKFKSGWGRINSIHQHEWPFSDTPLIIAALFGEEGLQEVGAQVTWIAPTDVFLQLGLEALRGENLNSFGTNGFTVGDEEVNDATQPNAWVGYAKTSFDVGETSILLGSSVMQGTARGTDDSIGVIEEEGEHEHGVAVDENEYEAEEKVARYESSVAQHVHGGGDEEEEDSDDPRYEMDTQIWAVDVTLKHFFDSYRSLTWVSEYIQRTMKGDLFLVDGDKLDFEKTQGGLYSQVVWRFAPEWSSGLRYDLITTNDVSVDNEDLDLENNLKRTSWMLDYKPTEFSVLRFQLNQEHARELDGEQKQVNDVLLQFDMSIGAHGAHDF